MQHTYTHIVYISREHAPVVPLIEALTVAKSTVSQDREHPWQPQPRAMESNLHLLGETRAEQAGELRRRGQRVSACRARVDVISDTHVEVRACMLHFKKTKQQNVAAAQIKGKPENVR